MIEVEKMSLEERINRRDSLISYMEGTAKRWEEGSTGSDGYEHKPNPRMAEEIRVQIELVKDGTYNDSFALHWYESEEEDEVR